MTRPRLPRRPTGVTLLEMMLVLVVMGILLAMGGARFLNMQVSNVFTNEVDRFGGELKMLGTAARTAGDLQPATLAVAINNTGLGTPQTGRFRWRSWQDGKVRQSGELGSRESITLQYSRAYDFRAAATKGVYMDVCKVGADGTLGSPLVQVLFKPDGSPVDPGDLRIGNSSRTYLTHLSPMGAIDGPRLP